MGCTTVERVLVPVPLTCSSYPEPTLSMVSVDELQMVSDETYEKLRKNEQKLLNYGRSNEKILKEICQ